MRTARDVALKYVARINIAVLPESTAHDYQFRYIDISAVDSAGRVTVPEQATTFGEAPSRARRLAGPGSVLVSTVRTYLRAIAPAPAADPDPLVFSTGFAVIDPSDGVDSRYLSYACRSDDFVETVVARSTGVSYPAISATDLGDIQLPIPAPEEQRRIADFLDDQVARIDDIIVARQAQTQISTDLWRSVLDRKIAGHDVRSARLGYFARVQTGVTVDGKRSVIEPVTVPYLRVANVQAGRLDIEVIKEIELDWGDLQRSMLRDGDVLMTEGGDIDKLGRGTVWRGQVPGVVVHQNHVFAVRCDRQRLLPEYLAYVTATSESRSYFEQTASKTTNLASTSATKVLDLPTPIRSVEVQRAIVDELDRVSTETDAAGTMLSQSAGYLAELKRSLITAAVSGEFDVSAADGSQVLVGSTRNVPVGTFPTKSEVSV